MADNLIGEFGPSLKFKDSNTARAKVGGCRSNNARIRRVDWIEPETFRLWSNVAFRGYSVTTGRGNNLIGAGEDSSFRGRSTQRNATFVEMRIPSSITKARDLARTVAALQALYATASARWDAVIANVAPGQAESDPDTNVSTITGRRHK